MKLKSMALATVAFAAMAAPASATTVFSFDWDSAVATPFAGGLSARSITQNGVTWFANPVAGFPGTVDLVSMPNSFGITCDGGAGKCIDLAGTFPVSAPTLFYADFAAVGTAPRPVTVSFRMSGAQRQSIVAGTPPSATGPRVVTVSVGNPLSSVWSQNFNPSDPFATYLAQGVATPVGGVIRVAFSIPGPHDFRGPILDSVTVAIPEPSTWMLMIMGFGLIASQLRRRYREGQAAAA